MISTPVVLHHQRIHHGAEISLIKAENEALLNRLLTFVALAQASLDKKKLHVTEYQLNVMRELLEAEASKYEV